MNSAELREKFQKFFESKRHARIPSASLVPANDSSVLFTTAGMHPLVPYLMGEAHANGKRLVNVQKCLRTDDIDEVGDKTHNTFFEMLGNWSLGDYWKDESIRWSYEFLTGSEWLGLDPLKLAVSVFAGDADAPRDDESAEIWLSLSIPKPRIAYLGKADNWWGPPAATGPCGPDTEIFYWTGEGAAPESFDASDKKWVELWNNVFMQYEKTADGRFIPLKQKNVDTGMGLERTSAVLQGKADIYQTELFSPIIDAVKSLSNKSDDKSLRIIADHMRASAFLTADGITPSNKDRGYILRRLVRRAITYALKLGIKQDLSASIIKVINEIYSQAYPELVNPNIVIELQKEEKKFRQTLAKGLKMLETNKSLSGKEAFDMFQTYGFPFELTREFGHVKDPEEFDQEFKRHQELSRTASAGQFKGGLASNSEKVTRLHTVTHLLNAALRKVLGEYVFQKGSNINEERARFDFTCEQKLTDEQKKEIEDLVNGWIKRDLPVRKDILPIEEARQLGAIGVFGEKYSDLVSVYAIQDPSTKEIISREFCGGPHVEHTSVIGEFRIAKEESVSAGVRRVKITIN
jgi:alanyl-tRNA synthetase